jgi:hypothetical protein
MGALARFLVHFDPMHLAVGIDRLAFVLGRRLRIDAMMSPRHKAFLEFRGRQRATSYSFASADLFVLHELESPRGGSFVEIGARDGVQASDTCLLEREYGWRGVLVEPDAKWHKALQANRRSELDGRFVAGGAGGRRTLGGREVEGVTLASLLHEYGAAERTDLLSIHAARDALDILRGHDFSRFGFRVVAVTHGGDSVLRARMAWFMLRKGFARVMPSITGDADWFVKR